MKAEDAVGTTISLWNYFNECKWDEAKALLSAEFEVYWPQSQEIIKGARKILFS